MNTGRNQREYTGKYDYDRILDGNVCLEEREALEAMLIRMFLERAKSLHKDVVLVKDPQEYTKLARSLQIFDNPDKFYLFVDKNNHVIDMSPIAYHMIDTREGGFYARLTFA